MAGIFKKFAEIKHAWNIFKTLEEPAQFASYGASGGYANRPEKTRMRFSNERSIIASILTRMSIDCASIDIQHSRVDKNQIFIDTITSGLNNCLTVEANIDQAARAFRQDIFSALFDEGCCAIVPIDITDTSDISANVDIFTMRVGRIINWLPEHIKVSVYNQLTGLREEVTVSKRYAAVVENPLSAIMNEPNSTLQRLIRKLNLLDVVDEQSSSGKLDLIIQLPYVVKSDARREQANQRRKDLEFQLKGSQYGVAYTDGTEKITQLNRPAENNLLTQVEYLMNLLYAQLGITTSIMDGTADEATMLNYRTRTIEPLVTAVVEAMRRTFITKTGRSQGQTLLSFFDPFKLVPLSQIADIADKFNRNEVLTGNEMRGIIGYKPSKDPKADQLRNSNMPEPKPVVPPQPHQPPPVPPEPVPPDKAGIGGPGQNGS